MSMWDQQFLELKVHVSLALSLLILEPLFLTEAKTKATCSLVSVGFYEMRMMVISIVKGCDDSEWVRYSEIVRILAGQLITFAAMTG
ncbi:hypothetical protein Tco_1147564, partial [Tanacetum coccineum]